MYGTDILMLNFSKLIFVSQDRIEKKSRLGINHCKVDILLFGKGKVKFQIKFILQVGVISFINVWRVDNIWSHICISVLRLCIWGSLYLG